MEKTKLIIIAGPTGSGKSALAVELAGLIDAEIISADSMQIYRGMDIGTAKATKEEQAKVPHHLIDIRDPDCDFTAADFALEAALAIEDITGRGKRVIVAGGTGLYIRALIYGLFEGGEKNEAVRKKIIEEFSLKDGKGGGEGSGKAKALVLALHNELRRVDPVSAERIHPNNMRRTFRALEVYRTTGRPISELQEESSFNEPRYNLLGIGLSIDRDALKDRIFERVDTMMEMGLLVEVRGLLDKEYAPELKSMGALGYSEMCAHIRGELSLDEAIQEIKSNTRRYAKRQMTWFKKDEFITWFDPEEKAGIITAVEDFYDI
jgi:tRNA dimethylallyltransferase